MIRLFLRLFGIRDFEPCASCSTLKQQLEYVTDQNKQLTDTLLRIVSPKAYETPPAVEINPVIQTSGLFSRRRQALEERDRQEARILAEKKHVAMPDIINPNKDNILNSISKLEDELGVMEKESEEKTS